MVTISDKRYGELVAKSIALDVYKNIADSQYEIIERKDKLNKEAMEEIVRLRKEVEGLKKHKVIAQIKLGENEAYQKRLNDELNAIRGEIKHWKELYIQTHSQKKALAEVIESVKNSVKDL